MTNRYKSFTLLASMLPAIASANFDSFGEDAVQEEAPLLPQKTVEVEYETSSEFLEPTSSLSEVAVEPVTSEVPIRSEKPLPKTKSEPSKKKAATGFNKTIRSQLVAPVSVYVNTQPSDAKVRIMNIKPKYRDGMKLKPGAYDIEVSKPGYRTQRLTKYLSDQQSNIDITLNKVGSLQCKDFQKKESGSWLSDSGVQLQFNHYLEGVTVSEIYSSALQFAKSQNNMFDLESDSSGDYAYIRFSTSPANKEEIDRNANVKVDRSREVKEIIGIEKAGKGSGVNLITHLEFPKYLVPILEDEYYCKMVKAL